MECIRLFGKPQVSPLETDIGNRQSNSLRKLLFNREVVLIRIRRVNVVSRCLEPSNARLCRARGGVTEWESDQTLARVGIHLLLNGVGRHSIHLLLQSCPDVSNIIVDTKTRPDRGLSSSKHIPRKSKSRAEIFKTRIFHWRTICPSARSGRLS